MDSPGNNLVIVAIPEKDDHVWKISSEKVPHLTLLNLGENKGANITKIVNHIQHVVDTTMQKFGLSVERRDTLGPNEADVLIFDKFDRKMLKELRYFLLANEEINRLYSSSVQFPTFIPHLTLGFPDSPAKAETRDWGGISWVNFDRLALWTGDSEGPEFRLKSDSDMEVAMSTSVNEVLEHFGIKGMRWGVRRSKAERGREISRTMSDDARNAGNAFVKAKRGGTHTLSNAELKLLIERMNLEKQYVQVVPTSTGRKVAKLGGKFAGDILLGVGKAQAIKLVTNHAGKVVSASLQAFKK